MPRNYSIDRLAVLSAQTASQENAAMHNSWQELRANRVGMTSDILTAVVTPKRHTIAKSKDNPLDWLYDMWGYAGAADALLSAGVTGSSSQNAGQTVANLILGQRIR